MHIHLPKPIHGWREFWGEVGIIVIGVLIALGAEQAVEALHWRHELHDFREALDQELALNLGTFELNQLQKPCIDRRLDELATVLDQARAGKPVRLAGRIASPVLWSQYRSVWENKNPQVVAHMPMAVRLQYGELYDEFRNTEVLKARQADTWAKMLPFEESGPLDLAERRQLHALIATARSVNDIMASNWPVSLRLAKALGIRPAYPSDVHDISAEVAAFEVCKPILPR